MERSIPGTKKSRLDGFTVARAYRPPGVSTLHRGGWITHLINLLHLWSIHFPWVEGRGGGIVHIFAIWEYIRHNCGYLDTYMLIHVHNEIRNGNKFWLDSVSFDTWHSFCRIKIHYTNEYCNECISLPPVAWGLEYSQRLPLGVSQEATI